LVYRQLLGFNPTADVNRNNNLEQSTNQSNFLSNNASNVPVVPELCSVTVLCIIFPLVGNATTLPSRTPTVPSSAIIFNAKLKVLRHALHFDSG
jgi:hypothetical protein